MFTMYVLFFFKVSFIKKKTWMATHVYLQRTGLPVTSVFESLERNFDSTELKGKIDVDGCISNSVDVKEAKNFVKMILNAIFYR